MAISLPSAWHWGKFVQWCNCEFLVQTSATTSLREQKLCLMIFRILASSAARRYIVHFYMRLRVTTTVILTRSAATVIRQTSYYAMLKCTWGNNKKKAKMNFLNMVPCVSFSMSEWHSKDSHDWKFCYLQCTSTLKGENLHLPVTICQKMYESSKLKP